MAAISNKIGTVSINQIEDWIDKTLLPSFRADSKSFANEKDSKQPLSPSNRHASHSQRKASAGEEDALKQKYYSQHFSPLEELEISREQLAKFGLDKASQDKMYRSCYVYSHAIFEFIYEFQHFDKRLSVKLWETFFRIFQYYDPLIKETFEDYLRAAQNATLLQNFQEASAKLANLQKQHDILREEHALLKLQYVGVDFEQQLNAQTYETLLAGQQNMYKDLQAQLSIAHDRLYYYDKQYPELQHVVQDNQIEMMSLLQFQHKQEQQYSQLYEKYKFLDRDYHDMKTKLHGKDSEINEVKTQLLKRKQINAELDFEVESLQSKEKELLTQHRNLTQDLLAYQQTTIRQEQIIDQYQDRMKDAVHWLEKSYSTVFTPLLTVSQQCESSLPNPNQLQRVHNHSIRARKQQRKMDERDGVVQAWDGQVLQTLQGLTEKFAELQTYFEDINTSTTDPLPPPLNTPVTTYSSKGSHKPSITPTTTTTKHAISLIHEYKSRLQARETIENTIFQELETLFTLQFPMYYEYYQEENCFLPPPNSHKVLTSSTGTATAGVGQVYPSFLPLFQDLMIHLKDLESMEKAYHHEITIKQTTHRILESNIYLPLAIAQVSELKNIQAKHTQLTSDYTQLQDTLHKTQTQLAQSAAMVSDYEDLKRKYLQLVSLYQVAVSEKLAVETAFTEQQVKVNAFSSEEKKYRDLYKEHMKVSHQLTEKTEYVKALQYEKTQLVKQQDANAFSSTRYEEWILHTFYPHHQFFMDFLQSCAVIAGQAEQGRYTTRSMYAVRSVASAGASTGASGGALDGQSSLSMDMISATPFLSSSGVTTPVAGTGAAGAGGNNVRTGIGSRGNSTNTTTGGGSRGSNRPPSAAQPQQQQQHQQHSSSRPVTAATTLLAIFDDCNIIERGELLNYLETLRVEKLTLTQGESYQDMNAEDKSKLISILDHYAQLPSLIFDLVKRQDELYDHIQKVQEEKDAALKQIGLLKTHFAKETRRMNEQLYEKNTAAVFTSLSTKKAPLEARIASDEQLIRPASASSNISVSELINTTIVDDIHDVM